jgi:hypothetical protein
MQDKRAKDILFGAFWKSGWKAEADRSIAAEDFAYAKQKAYMFDPVTLSHDQVVVQLTERSRSVIRGWPGW